MGKLFKRLTFGLIGVSGGLAGLAPSAGVCGSGACASCLRCAGLGIALVALAIMKKKGEQTN